MSWKIGMPNLGHTMEEGKVSEWLKAIGQPVNKGEVIAVVESDKASFDIESPADGVLGAIYADADSVVAVGEAIGLVIAPGEAVTQAPVDVASVPDRPQQPVHRDASSAQPTERAARGRISPAARALAEASGLDWQAIVGSGDDGMITRDDIREHAAARTSDKATPLSPMRRAIAEATGRAWQTIPHVPLHSHADVTALVAAGGSGITAAIIRACGLALGEHPAFNGWLIDNAFKPSRHSDIALAVATPTGLVTAVVSAAQSKSISALHTEIGSLAASARLGRLDGAKMTGASFTVSSLGRWGVDAFAPIIPAPQVAILGVGRIDRVAREGPGGSVIFASEICLTLVFDHRANDGVQAAQLLSCIVGYLESPGRMETVP